jgi:hypothetical protein
VYENKGTAAAVIVSRAYYIIFMFKELWLINILCLNYFIHFTLPMLR